MDEDIEDLISEFVPQEDEDTGHDHLDGQPNNLSVEGENEEQNLQDIISVGPSIL